MQLYHYIFPILELEHFLLSLCESNQYEAQLPFKFGIFESRLIAVLNSIVDMHVTPL